MRVNPGAGPVVMLEAHCDEIGFIVQYIDDDGLLTLSPLGGVTIPLVAGERIVLLGPKGAVNGVFAVRPIHLMTQKERENCAPTRLDQIQVDIGASSKEKLLPKL